MNYIKNSLLIFIVLSLAFVSCDKEEFTINENEAFANKIGFISSKTGNFVEVNKTQLESNWKKIFDLDESVKFNDFRVIKSNYADTNNEYYTLKTISEGGTISIATKLTVDQQNQLMILDTKTCKCESVTCSWSGCDASLENDNCMCSSCTGDCKKTSTVTNDLTEAF